MSNLIIQWEDKYEVGNKTVDSQHQGLVKIINSFFSNKKDTNDGFFDITIKRLEDYTIEHFKDEEEIMEELGSPDLEAHKKEHLRLIEKLADIKLKHANQKMGIKLEMLNLFQTWLVNHIMNTDKISFKK